jgi:multiple PDZ domain protein
MADGLSPLYSAENPDDYSGELKSDVASAIASRWRKMLGAEFAIIVAHLTKQRNGGGWGISLEGTVDVERGQDVRPHHYIRGILADGPVGVTKMFQSGDELLEVNGRRLLGTSRGECVAILKELPFYVRMVCARRKKSARRQTTDFASRPDTPDSGGASDTEIVHSRNHPPNPITHLTSSITERLIKAKSDGSLAIVPAIAAPSLEVGDPSKLLRSRSLEPLSDLSMWSSEATVVELQKGDRGLGFSILVSVLLCLKIFSSCASAYSACTILNRNPGLVIFHNMSNFYRHDFIVEKFTCIFTFMILWIPYLTNLNGKVTSLEPFDLLRIFS